MNNHFYYNIAYYQAYNNTKLQEVINIDYNLRIFKKCILKPFKNVF